MGHSVRSRPIHRAGVFGDWNRSARYLITYRRSSLSWRFINCRVSGDVPNRRRESAEPEVVGIEFRSKYRGIFIIYRPCDREHARNCQPLPFDLFFTVHVCAGVLLAFAFLGGGDGGGGQRLDSGRNLP